MPYISQQRRNEMDTFHDGDTFPRTPGELNYDISSMLANYIDTRGGLTYQTINDILGALEGAKLEFYRRIVVPYEVDALARNGDVY